jgi:hypothetical protein
VASRPLDDDEAHDGVRRGDASDARSDDEPDESAGDGLDDADQLDDADEFDDLDGFDLDPDELEMRVAARNYEREQRAAWGSWRQDREQNRKKVLRSLFGLLIGSVLAGFVAYGCSVFRAPQQVRFADTVSGYQLQPSTPDNEQLAGQLQAAGAVGPAARYYRGGSGEVLLIAGYSTQIPTDVVSSLLPPVTADDNDLSGRGGPLNCGATAEGSRCVWKSTDLVGGTSARGMAPAALEKITRDLRAGAIR